jgi:hypothetical protein
MVGAPDSGNTAAWACGHEASTLPLLPSGRLPIAAARAEAKAVIEHHGFR